MDIFKFELRDFCPDWSGLTASFRAEPDDFIVEELPAYEASGEGQFEYLWVEKRELSTNELVRRLSRIANSSPRDIGYAGLKDAYAVTRQWLSVPGPIDMTASELSEALDRRGRVTILERRRHKNKLKLGHLTGNRFHIRLRRGESEAAFLDEDVDQCRAVLEQLAQRGVPNIFGLQRFGERRHTHLLGLALIDQRYQEFVEILLGGAGSELQVEGRAPAVEAYKNGDLEQALSCYGRADQAEVAVLRALIKSGGNAQRAAKSVPKSWLNFYYSAACSALFNQYCLTRLREFEDNAELWPGEVVMKRANAAAFRVDDLEVEAQRLSQGELELSGPMFGAKLLRPALDSQAYELEETVLHDWRVTAEALGRGKLRLRGQRRFLRVRPENWSLTKESDRSLLLVLDLPRGSYATTLVEQLLKRELR